MKGAVRLDRILCNSSWRLLYPTVGVCHLPQICSDYCPLLLLLETSVNSGQTTPFRFQVAWQKYPDYDAFILNCWHADVPLVTALECM
uniref:Uncharacterized protein n=1 Tax=Manihot esculenta TaxID=3983 RepID=A0A199UAU9_MANES